MSTYITKIISSILFTCFAIIAFGQSPTKRQFINSAEKMYAEKNYFAALKFYESALEYDPKDVYLLYKAAESARKFNSFKKAESKYRLLVDSIQTDLYPDATYWLAKMLLMQGKYEDAREYYNRFTSEVASADSIMLQSAKNDIKSLDFADNLLNLPPKVKTFDKVGYGINTPASEVSGKFQQGVFIYSSMNYKESKPETLPAREISKLLIQKEDNAPELLQGTVNQRELSVSNQVIAPDGKTIFYTICAYVNGSELSCEIYKGTYDKTNAQITDEIKLPPPVNIVGSTSTHPHVVHDKKLGKDVLYFVSNREGGKGGLDIWSCVWDEKFGFSEPINLMSVNTAQDDITPYYSTASDQLFFSSNGREGLGGFDIFKVSKIGDEFGTIVNAGHPLNSSYNDIYYWEDEGGINAYLSSNREGALFIDDYYEACCYDIYKAEIKRILLDLNALTYDKLTGRDLKKATVILIDTDTNEELGRIYNEDGIDHKFEIEGDRNYTLIAERENYNPATLTFSTTGYTESQEIIQKLYLETDMMLLDVYTFSKISKLPLKGTTVTLIDITDPSKPQIVETNPLSNDFYFMLDRGKEYKIIGQKQDYTSAEEYVDTRPYEKSGLIRKDLYLDKFELPDLLPIAMYFDNDLPNPRSKSTETLFTFGDLIQQYMGRKETYKTEFTKGLTQEQKTIYDEKYEAFFEGDVKGGYDQFRLFLVQLVNELEAGNKVELVIKGFASPRAERKYNLILGQRRVNAIKNEMVEYNPLVKQYFKSKQLLITDISFGRELAPPDVSEDLKDERNSIYNLKAAKERRVEILRAQRN